MNIKNKTFNGNTSIYKLADYIRKHNIQRFSFEKCTVKNIEINFKDYPEESIEFQIFKHIARSALSSKNVTSKVRINGMEIVKT